MGYSVLDFIKKLGIFIICAQSFIHFSAGKSYEKYVKLLIGIMVLAQFVVPVRALFLGKENAQIWDEVDRFKAEMEESLKQEDMEDFSRGDEDTVSEALADELKSKLKDTVASCGYQVERVEIQETEDGKQKLLVMVSKKDTGQNRIRIEKIAVGSSPEEQHPEKEEEMKAAIAACLGTESSYIDMIVK